MIFFKTWEDIEFPKTTIKNPRIQVGEYTYYAGHYHKDCFERQCVLYPNGGPDGDRLFIGKFCSIASGVSFNIGGSQRHRKEWVATYPFHYMFPEDSKVADGYNKKGDTIVGNDVWIGYEAQIMPGVRIGDGAIIAARAVVTKDVEPYCIVGGVPAKPLSKRFDDDTIASFLEIAWWDFDIENLKKIMPLLTSENIQGAIRLGQEIRNDLQAESQQMA